MDDIIKEIKLTQGKVVIVDAEDFDYLNQWKWLYNGHGYAARIVKENDIQKMIFMHRLLLEPPNGYFTDHINRNTLDNRRANLRIANKSQNAANRGKDRDNTSGIKGVSWATRDKKWRAHIMVNKKYISLGYYDDIEEAANAYKKAAEKYFGEFAYAE